MWICLFLNSWTVELPTRRFRRLESRVRQIESRFLPAINPVGNYSDVDYDRTRAYLLLCHAEIEACVEDLAGETLGKSVTRWSADNRARKALISLVAYHDPGFPAAPASLTTPPQKPPPNLKGRVGMAERTHRHRIQTNNGVKERDLLQLLLPVGVLESDLDPTWLLTMNSFGTQRGLLAHAAAHGVAQPPDPRGAQNTVKAVLDGLEKVDDLLSKLSR